MSHKVTLIPGDGIGPEVTNATVRILEATGVKFEWETFAVGAEAYEKSGRVYSQGSYRVSGADARRIERSGDHADRRGLP